MLETFDISSRKLINYLLTLETHYLNVPYHNSMHAADVAQAVHVLLLSPALDVSILNAPKMIISLDSPSLWPNHNHSMGEEAVCHLDM